MKHHDSRAVLGWPGFLVKLSLMIPVLGVMLLGKLVEPAHAQSYIFTELPNPAGAAVFQPNGINNAGQIIGLSVASSISDMHGLGLGWRWLRGLSP